MLYKMMSTGRINININIADTAITGILSNFANLILLIISNDTIMLITSAIYGLNSPLK